MLNKELSKKHKEMEIKRRSELRRKSMEDQARIKKFLQKNR